MKKILLIGEIYSDNLGDGVIYNNVNYLLKKSFKNIQIDILDLSGRKSFEKKATITRKESKNKQKFNGIKEIVKKNYISNYLLNKAIYQTEKIKRKDFLLDVRKQIDKDYDVAIFAGGQLFLEYFVMNIENIVGILEKNNIPVIFNACGYGKFENVYKLNKLKKVLAQKNIKFISVRDSVSKVNSELLPKSHLISEKTNDTAVWSSDSFNIKKNTSSEIVGIGVIRLPDDVFMEKQFEMINNIIKELDIRGIEWEIFTNGSSGDYHFSKSIYEYTKSNLKQIANKPKTPEELVGLISKYKSIISFRLHSHIVAAALSIPSVGISWDKKVEHHFEGFDALDRCFTIDDDSIEIIEKVIEVSALPLDKEILELQKSTSKDMLIETILKLI